MATTPEEFFMEGLTNLSPPSPSVFLNLPRMPEDAGQEDSLCPVEMVLSYVSHVLMEDHTEEELLCQDADHHALLQVQEPFAQILSSPSFSTNSSDNTINRDNVEGAKNLLQGYSGDQCTLRASLSTGALAMGSAFNGKEEASRFLPKDNGFSRDQQVNQMVRESGNCRVSKKRYNGDEQLDGEVGRARKVIMLTDELEEMFDKMMLRGYETCIEDMKKLRIAKADEAKKNNNGDCNAKRDLVDLCTLLMRCAQAVAASSVRTAHELLKQIKQHASATGDATQRLAQCFAKALEARLTGTGSQIWQFLTAEERLAVEYLRAYNLYMATCCFNRVALFFNVMTIENAMVGKRKLHIVDYGTHHGFQWAGLLRWMANREGGPPEVKITAISRLQPRSCPSEGTESTGHRLGECARKFGVPFEFHAINAKWETVCIGNLKREADEVLVVVDLFNFSILEEESLYFDNPSPRDTVLNNIRKMRPDVFIQGVVNCSYGTSFLTRFREALFYYSAMFDMLDATIAREDKLRPLLEQNMLCHSVLNVIACEGADMVNRPEKYRQWQLRNRRAGLRQLPLEPNTLKVLKDKVMKDHHKDFFIIEDGQWLLQGWMGRILYAHSTWVAEDTIISE